MTLRRGTIPPTINHEDPDPTCGSIRVVTEAETVFPQRVLVHAIGLGGFYYSAATFEAVQDDASNVTGVLQVRWSRGANPRFQPVDEFQRPLEPWSPRQTPVL